MRVLVLGSASCVWKDIEIVLGRFVPDMILAVNDIATEYRNVDHFCTMHPEKMFTWLKIREAKQFPIPVLWTAGHRVPPTRLRFQRIASRGGGSGLLAVRVARHLGAKKIVLAGMPLDGSLGYFHKEGPWRECAIYRRSWEKEKRLFDDVRSVSGWSAGLFGSVNWRWLKDAN